MSSAILLSVLAALMVGIKVGVWLERRRIALSTPSRKGVITLSLKGAGALNKGSHYQCTALVTELENIGNGYSRVRVDAVNGLSDEYMVRQAKSIIGNLVPTNEVKWADELAPLAKD